jgi:RimJ/RimL family protein N-acetyltransferase
MFLPSGHEVVVRPIVREDAEEIAAGFLQLSAESRFRRFAAGTPRLSRSHLDYLTTVDHHDHEALVALVPGRTDIIGVARFVRSRTQPDSAEIAVTVADEWHRRGLGTSLLERLADRARAEGITRITAEIVSDNRGMQALFRHLGPTSTGADGSVVADITPRDPDPEPAQPPVP